MEQSGVTWRRRSLQFLWQAARAILIVYLLVVLLMMLLETHLVYPIPPANASDWHPTGFNYADVSSLGEFAAMLSKSLQASVLVFDYRGYGHSQGRPSETGCIADGNSAQHWLAQRMHIRPQEVVLMGRSLGSAVAIALAADNG